MNQDSPAKPHRRLWFAILIIVLLLAVLHLFIPTMAGLTEVAFSFIILGTVLFGVAIMLLFLFAGISFLVFTIPFAIWTIIVILLFPILFPIFLPLFIIFLFIALMRKSK